MVLVQITQIVMLVFTAQTMYAFPSWLKEVPARSRTHMEMNAAIQWFVPQNSNAKSCSLRALKTIAEPIMNVSPAFAQAMANATKQKVIMTHPINVPWPAETLPNV